MAQLTPEQRQDRLRFDYRVATQMRTPVMSVTAYRNADDLAARRNPVASEDEGHEATHYLVDYYMKTLAGEGRFLNKTSVMFDLLANGNYPYTPPTCFVVSKPIPWTPHFTEDRPICTDDDLWVDARGRMLLGHWLVHVAKLINFDEIPHSGGGTIYGGYTPDAARYWFDHYKQKPITPDFPYPPLPAWISSKPVVMFESAQNESLFEPKEAEAADLSPGETSDAVFEPASDSRPASDSLFEPR
jgi:hypothetical protein